MFHASMTISGQLQCDDGDSPSCNKVRDRYENSVDCCYAMPVSTPVLQLLQGRLQVDELIHQQERAGHVGDAGL